MEWFPRPPPFADVGFAMITEGARAGSPSEDVVI